MHSKSLGAFRSLTRPPLAVRIDTVRITECYLLKGVNVCSVKIQLKIFTVYILVKNMVEVIGFFGYSLPCLIFESYWFLVSCGSHRAACGGWRGNEA